MFIKVIKLEKDKYYSGSDEWSYKEVPTLINTVNIECVYESEKGMCIILFTSGYSMHVKGTLGSAAQLLWSVGEVDGQEVESDGDRSQV